MKKLLLFLFILSFSSCFAPRSGYIDYRERRMYDWDPIYYVPGFYDPFFNSPYYRRTPIIIYRNRTIPAPPQRPREYNNTPSRPPYTPNPRPGGPSNAPIRKFPDRKEEK